MAGIRDRIASGIPVGQARALAGMESIASAVSAAGSSISDGTALTATNNLVTTTASSTGVLLPDAEVGSEIWVVNGGANTLKVYAPTTSGKINNAATSAGASVATLKGAIFKRIDSVNWLCVQD